MFLYKQHYDIIIIVTRNHVEKCTRLFSTPTPPTESLGTRLGAAIVHLLYKNIKILNKNVKASSTYKAKSALSKRACRASTIVLQSRTPCRIDHSKEVFHFKAWKLPCSHT